MSLLKYLQTIEGIDPGKIEVENVRSILNVNSRSAKFICEMAVQEKLFIKKIGLVCPNEGRVIEEFDSYNEIPEQITCHICETDEREHSTFKTSQLQKIEFYKLKK